MTPALAIKAEIVLALQLILRHRAPRLALLLASSLVTLLVVGGSAEAGLAVRQRTIVLIGGTLSAVASSRLLSFGGPLSSVRRVASPWLLVPAGRLVGAVLFTLAALLGAVMVVIAGTWGALPAVQTAIKLGLYAAAVGAPVMALTPLIGASAAAAAGLLAAFLGSIPPSELGAILGPWPLLRGAAVLLWNTLPLSWRATRWLGAGGIADPLVLTGWMVFGVCAAALVAQVHGRSARAEHP